MNRTWKITGYDSTTVIYEATAVMSEARAKDALRLLAARHLSETEIVEALANRSSSTLLDVRLDQGGKINGYSSGSDPWYTAVPHRRD